MDVLLVLNFVRIFERFGLVEPRLQNSGVRLLYHVLVVVWIAELICLRSSLTITMAHMVNTNPPDEEELNNDSGAYIVKFGKHAGERLDSIPTDYRLWATGAECQHFRWVRTHYSRYVCH